MRRLPAAGVAFCLTLTAPPSSLAAPSESWPNRPQAARSGDFAVVQFATTDPRGAMAAWDQRTAGAKLKVTHEVRMGVPISTFINFKNCARDRRGLCNVTTEWSVGQVGAPLDVVATTRVHVGLPPPPGGAIGISREAPAITFAPPDRPGVYVIRARTTDHVSRVTLQTEDRITVRP